MDLTAGGLIAFALVLGLLIAVPLFRLVWLRLQHGVFSCSHRSRLTAWSSGIARYRGEALEWFPLFGFVPTPAKSFDRRITRLVNERSSTDERRVLSLEHRISGEIDLIASDADSALAVMSWFEAAPPGSHYLPAGTDIPPGR